MIEVKELFPKDFPEVIKLSLAIFRPQSEWEFSFYQIDKWRENYQRNGILLGGFVDKKLVGFLFGCERKPDKKEFHAWVGGVDKDYRRRGIMKALMKNLTDLAKEKGYHYLTANNFPSKAPVMSEFLKKSGFEMYQEKEKKERKEKLRQCYFRKKI